MLRNTHFTQVFLGSYHRRPGQPGKGCSREDVQILSFTNGISYLLAAYHSDEYSSGLRSRD